MSEMDKDILKDNISKKNNKAVSKSKNNKIQKKNIKKQEEKNKKDTNKVVDKSFEIDKVTLNSKKENNEKKVTNKKRSKKRSNRSKNSSNKINDNKVLKDNSKKELDNKSKSEKINSFNKNLIDEKTKKDNRSVKISKSLDVNNEKKNNNIVLIIVILLFLIMILSFASQSDSEHFLPYDDDLIQDEIKQHYNEFVITNKDAKIYKLSNNERYVKVGMVSAKQELTLDTENTTYEDEYFKIADFDGEYYIYYKDLDIIEELSLVDKRYEKYILFNQNIKTKDKVSFYDDNGDLVYKFNLSFDLPIIVNKNGLYGVELNGRLLYVKKEDISKIDDNLNTRLLNTRGIAVLNYHFFYDDTIESEKTDCNQIICHSKSGFIRHLEYIKNNNIFTPTMKEFEMYLNGEIKLPKSVVITIDDGWRTEIATQLLEKYQLNGTIFLITSWFEEIDWLDKSKYVEYHSHGDNIHNHGECPGGQGGAIKCLEKDKLLKDLETSRQKLNGTTAFCYPFYEYNDYSISILKEAGFTLAFALGDEKATVDTDKYQIPRYVMYDSTTVNQLRNYID